MQDQEGAFSQAADNSGMDRRQLLRAGAWAAPVIVLATASPASAASTDPYELVLDGTNFNFGWSSSGQRTGIVGSTQVRVVFHPDAATITGITLVVQLTAT